MTLSYKEHLSLLSDSERKRLADFMKKCTHCDKETTLANHRVVIKSYDTNGLRIDSLLKQQRLCKECRDAIDQKIADFVMSLKKRK